MSDDDVRSAIRGWLTTMFPTDGAFGDDVSLRDHGVLDSMRVIQLVAWLESTFGVEVAREDLTSGALDTVAGMVALVRRGRAAS